MNWHSSLQHTSVCEHPGEDIQAAVGHIPSLYWGGGTSGAGDGNLRGISNSRIVTAMEEDTTEKRRLKLGSWEKQCLRMPRGGGEDQGEA